MFHEDLAAGEGVGLAQDVALDELVVTILIVLCDLFSVNTLDRHLPAFDLGGFCVLSAGRFQQVLCVRQKKWPVKTMA
ncbi:hypothetical protein ACIPLA_01795 [Pseudomonas sp. NPDC086112]|uniref:hypothetical protein n=1 Tax=unclassified Pseudomonas TaxID=196821 RepID=UPI0017868707|nr:MULTISPECIES: hypothetical protein [unclassified Pseudomonas]MBD9564135.1 hypothetical protein [Pseudomonas sp. PDM09]MBV7494061.1 hypothetical protein [Pseudomonas sp. PDM24]